MRFIPLFLILIFTAYSQRPPKWIKRKAPSKSGKFSYFTGCGLTKAAAIAQAYDVMAKGSGINIYKGGTKKMVIIEDGKRKTVFVNEGTIISIEKKYDVKHVDSYYDGKWHYVLIGTKL